jgi:hypothetical protein
MPSASKTAYSIGLGGQAGYLNVGGWNSTLTDANTNPAEVCGMVRQEGANKYIYVMNGSQSSTRGAFVAICTALTDGTTTGFIAPIRVTSVAAAAASIQGAVFGMVVPTNVYTNQYCWVLRQGITTCYLQTDSAIVNGNYIMPGVTSANTWLTPATNTANGFALESAGTSTAVSGGFLAYVNFQGGVGSP